MDTLYAAMRKVLSACYIEHYGICAYGDVLPLIPCGRTKKIPSGAKSVIVCLFPYFINFAGRNISRYAAVRDYHEIAGEILDRLCDRLRHEFPDEAFAPFVDASPFREVEAARLAGLGDIGMNGLLIQKNGGVSTYGSYVFIGTVVTTAEAEPAIPGGRCEGCGKCINACPTGALTGDGLDTEKCRSYITQKRSELNGFEYDQVKQGGLVWGCDICQDVCPHNRSASETPVKAFLDSVQPIITADNVEALYPDRAFNYRNISVIKRNLDILRNDNGHDNGDIAGE